MIKLGKYGGTDINSPVYELAETLSLDYVDISGVQTFIDVCQYELGLSIEVAKAYASDYILSVGQGNLSETDSLYATQHNLI